MIKKLKHLNLISSTLLISISLSCTFLEAQNFERFSNKEGFNQNTINTISQDRYGFLWFGTPNGLIKYDGYEFETFTTQSGTNGRITSNYITNLFNDSNGILWIGTNVGINIYVPWLEKFYTIPLTSKLHINDIRSGPNGAIWFAGGNKLYACIVKDITNGIFKVSANILESHANVPNINQFSFTDDNSLILGTSNSLKEVTFEKGIINIDGQIERIINFDNFNNLNVNSIKKTKNILWIGTYSGLFKTSFENSRIHVIRKYNTDNTLHESNIPYRINTIFEDNNAAIWVATRESGLLKYIEESDEFINYTYSPKNDLGLSSNLINTIFQDNYDVLWIGTAQGGINKLDIAQKQFINYSKNPYDKETISDNLVTSILEDKRGRLWVSTYNRDLFRSTKAINDKTVKHIKFENISKQVELFGSKNIIRDIYEDQKGFIWIATDINILVYNPTQDNFKEVILEINGKPDREQVYRIIYQMDDTSLLFLGKQITLIKTALFKFKN